jgi:hypothetical protein
MRRYGDSARMNLATHNPGCAAKGRPDCGIDVVSFINRARSEGGSLSEPKLLVQALTTPREKYGRQIDAARMGPARPCGAIAENRETKPDTDATFRV